MREDIVDRIVEEANYIASTGATVRTAAKVFGVSKSTVHKDVTDRLYYIDKRLHKRVKKSLEKNLAERHIRGGDATRQKYKDAKLKNAR